jgi:hypothetical protein
MSDLLTYDDLPRTLGAWMALKRAELMLAHLTAVRRSGRSYTGSRSSRSTSGSMSAPFGHTIVPS